MRFTKPRKIANGAKREWLRCSDKKAKSREYVRSREVYKRAAGKAKRKFEESRRNGEYVEEPHKMVGNGEEAWYDGW